LKLSFGVTQTPQKERKSQVNLFIIIYFSEKNQMINEALLLPIGPMAPGEGEDQYPSYPTDQFDTGL
jgi:hypothetical protein